MLQDFLTDVSSTETLTVFGINSYATFQVAEILLVESVLCYGILKLKNGICH